MEFDPFLQLKGPGQLVLRYGPFLRQIRLYLHIFIEAYQVIEDILIEYFCCRVCAEVRIKGRRVTSCQYNKLIRHLRGLAVIRLFCFFLLLLFLIRLFLISGIASAG